MLGWIKAFYDDTKSGVIVGTDGAEYSFCMTDMLGIDFPTSNAVVEFEAVVGGESRQAKSVKIIRAQEPRPQYINLGNTRIRLSDIILYWTQADAQKNYRDRGFWKTSEYIGNTNTYHIYIRTSSDKEYDYKLVYTDEKEFLAACATLDRCLLVASL